MLHARLDLGSLGSPLPGIAERLVAVLYDGTLARVGQRNWDVATPSGRIQVKALWDVGKRTRRRLGIVGTEFDVLVAVVFDAQGRVSEVWEVDDEALTGLRGEATRAVVRLPWVRANGVRVVRNRVERATAALGLEVA